MQPNPNPFNPPHQPPEIDLPAERSVAPKVLGILNLMFAVMGILGAVVGLLMVWGIQAVESSPNNPAVEMMQNPGYKRALLFAIPLGVLATISLATAGVGLLRYKRWGRLASFLYIGITVINTIVGAAINYVWILAPMLQQALQPGVEQAQAAGAVGGVAGGLAGSCMGLIYPLVLLIFMNRRHVVASLE